MYLQSGEEQSIHLNKMMNICNSCFGGGAKYLGQSPVEESHLSSDAQKLLPKGSERSLVISNAPGCSDQELEPSHSKDSPSSDKLIHKVEGGDSGTCVDDMGDKTENSVKNCDENEEKDTYPSLQIEPALPHTPRFDVRKSDTDALIDDSEAYIEVPDPVQLTVSSIGSIGGVLEDVPEHCELGIRRDSAGVPASSVVSEETETLPLLLQEGGSSRPTPKIRHHSFGSQTARTVLTANPAEGNFTLNIFRTR